MAKPRSQRRIFGASTHALYPAETSLGWRVARIISSAQAAEMLAEGRIREVAYETGEHAGYQIVANAAGDLDVESRASSAAITARESRIAAGLHGASRTLGMSEDRRMARRNRNGRALQPEDAVERAVAKMQFWPQFGSRIDNGRGAAVYGDRAVRCYPKSS